MREFRRKSKKMNFMSNLKPKAVRIDALDEIEPLVDGDKEIEELWELFEDVPMNPETEQIENSFMEFPVGTDREEIWHWFDEQYSKGVHYLLYERE